MHHNGKTLLIIESLVKLAKGTLDPNGIAELRNQLAPAAEAPVPVNEQPTLATAIEAAEAALYWADSRTVKERKRGALFTLFELLGSSDFIILSTGAETSIRFTGNDNRRFVACVDKVNETLR